jgi:hypothetical protein
LKRATIDPWFAALDMQPWGEDHKHVACPDWFHASFRVLATITLGQSAVRQYGDSAFSEAGAEGKTRFIREDHYQVLVTELLRFVGRAMAEEGKKRLFECIDGRTSPVYCKPLQANGDTDICCLFRGGRLALVLELKLRFVALKNLAQAFGCGFAFTSGLSKGNTTKIDDTAWQMPTNPTHRPFVFIMAPFCLTRAQFKNAGCLKRDTAYQQPSGDPDLDAFVKNLSTRLWASLQILKQQLLRTEAENSIAPPDDRVGGDDDSAGDNDSAGDDNNATTPPQKKSPGGNQQSSDASAALSPVKKSSPGGGGRDGTNSQDKRTVLGSLSQNVQSIAPLNHSNLLKFTRGANLSKMQLAAQRVRSLRTHRAI